MGNSQITGLDLQNIDLNAILQFLVHLAQQHQQQPPQRPQPRRGPTARRFAKGRAKAAKRKQTLNKGSVGTVPDTMPATLPEPTPLTQSSNSSSRGTASTPSQNNKGKGKGTNAQAAADPWTLVQHHKRTKDDWQLVPTDWPVPILDPDALTTAKDGVAWVPGPLAEQLLENSRAHTGQLAVITSKPTSKSLPTNIQVCRRQTTTTTTTTTTQMRSLHLTSLGAPIFPELRRTYPNQVVYFEGYHELMPAATLKGFASEPKAAFTTWLRAQGIQEQHIPELGRARETHYKGKAAVSVQAFIPQNHLSDLLKLSGRDGLCVRLPAAEQHQHRVLWSGMGLEEALATVVPLQHHAGIIVSSTGRVGVRLPKDTTPAALEALPPQLRALAAVTTYTLAGASRTCTKQQVDDLVREHFKLAEFELLSSYMRNGVRRWLLQTPQAPTTTTTFTSHGLLTLQETNGRQRSTTRSSREGAPVDRHHHHHHHAPNPNHDLDEIMRDTAWQAEQLAQEAESAFAEALGSAMGP